MLKELAIENYDQCIALWRRIPGMGLSEADSKERIEAFLKRNVGMSFAYLEDEQIVGTILAGHDGRRGYIYHVAVEERYRQSGIGQVLVAASLARLKEAGIEKCHLFVFADNLLGQAFWGSTGWKRRNDIAVFSKDL